MEQRKARIRLQFQTANHAPGFRIPETSGPLRTLACRAHCDTATVRQPAMADDGRCTSGSPDQGDRCEKSFEHGLRRSGGIPRGDRMSTNTPNAPVAQEAYIVSEGKKRGSTREVRDAAAFDRYYTV